jgi:type I restriction enzyme S subunit
MNLTAVSGLSVAVPPPEEQSRIADAIADADELIAALCRSIAKKQAIKQGMMQQLLTGRIRLAGFTDEWKTKSLQEDVALISGHHVLAQNCNTCGRGVPYLTGPADFPDGRIHQTKFTDKPTSMCRAGDILVTVKGSGAGTLVEADASYCISRQLMAIRTNAWDSRFLLYSFLQNARSIKDAVTGLIPGLSRSDILSQTIPVPSVGEQCAIAAVLSDIDAALDALDARLTKARDIKQGMMQQLLTGRTRLSVQEAIA